MRSTQPFPLRGAQTSNPARDAKSQNLENPPGTSTIHNINLKVILIGPVDFVENFMSYRKFPCATSKFSFVWQSLS